MIFFRKCLFVAISAVSFLFLSCDNDLEIEQPDTVVPGYPSATALTVTLTAKINGVSNTDLAFGKGGVMFCKKDENAESIFRSWKDGVDEPEGCIVFQGGRVAGGEYNGTIKNLYPDTEYNYCIFFKNKDNSIREISDVMTFRTIPLEPLNQSFGVGQIRMFSAVIAGVLRMNSTDFNNSSWGIMVTDSEDGEMDKCIRSVVFAENDQNTTLQLMARYLSPGTDYWYRSYIKYSTYDNKDHYYYGPATKFTTHDDSGWGVDMGLPSGILWARCNLGIEDFENSYENIFNNPYYCSWGSLNSPQLGNETYEHWDAKTHSYINIGNNIAGTQYDIAHVTMGGKWRLPTKADVEELINYASIGKIQEKQYYYTEDNYSIIYHTSCVPITGPNGKGFSTLGYGIWTGTMSENGINPYCAYCDYYGESDSLYIELCDTIPRETYFTIRPVWDPNL